MEEKHVVNRTVRITNNLPCGDFVALQQEFVNFRRLVRLDKVQ